MSPISIAVSTPPLLGSLRAAITALTFNSPYLDAAEQLRANHHVHECQDGAQLLRWLTNTAKELARRAAVAAAPASRRYATAAQRTLIRALLQLPTLSQAHKTRVLLGLNHLTPAEAAAELQQLWGLVAVDGVADGRDRHRAATFQPAASLTYAAMSRSNDSTDHA